MDSGFCYFRVVSFYRGFLVCLPFSAPLLWNFQHSQAEPAAWGRSASPAHVNHADNGTPAAKVASFSISLGTHRTAITLKPSSIQWLFKQDMPKNGLLDLLKPNVSPDPSPCLVSDSVNKVLGYRACISSKFSSGTTAAGWGHNTSRTTAALSRSLACSFDLRALTGTPSSWGVGSGEQELTPAITKSPNIGCLQPSVSATS